MLCEYLRFNFIKLLQCFKCCFSFTLAVTKLNSDKYFTIKLMQKKAKKQISVNQLCFTGQIYDEYQIF